MLGAKWAMAGQSRAAGQANALEPPTAVPYHDRELDLGKKFQKVEQLPDDDKNTVKKLLGAFLTKKHLQALAR